MLGQQYQTRELLIVSLTERGTVTLHTGDLIRFSLPGMISSDLAARCGTLEVPENEHQLEARLKILRHLTKLIPSIAQTVLRARYALADAYDLLRHKDPDQRATTTLSHMTRMFKRKPSFLDLIAVHRVVGSNVAYIWDRTYLLTHSITLRAFNDLKRIQTLNAWVAQKRSPIDSFVAKARSVVEESQRLQRESFNEPVSFVKGSHTWTEDDKTILLNMIDAMATISIDGSHPSQVVQSVILRRIKPDIDSASHPETFELLTELGVVPPWQDNTLHMSAPTRVARESIERLLIKTHHRQERPSPSQARVSNPTSQPLGPTDFYPSDPMASHRHDFGNLPVYVVDDSSAKELDDGFSIEKVGDDYWVHVHVADPASVIPPTHVLVPEAEKNYMTQYYPLQVQYMIPPTLTMSKIPGMSIGSSDGPQHVMSFSARVNTKGEILDYKVRSGVVHNLVKVTYDTLDELMNWQRPKYSFPFGNPVPRDLRPMSLTPAHREDLRLAYEVRDIMVKRRHQNGVFVTAENIGEAVIVNPIQDVPPVSFDGRLYKGFVGLTYRVENISETMVGARSVVGELMITASRTASLFCQEHQIPVLYRTLPAPPFQPDLDVDALLRARTPDGFVSRLEAVPFLDYDLRSKYSLQPDIHWAVGANEGYVRTTSPLRRYLDLLHHWQINAAIRREKPIFSQEDLIHKADLYPVIDRWHKRDEGRSRITWQIYFLQRWMAENEANGKEAFPPVEAVVMDIPQQHNRRLSCIVPVNIPSLGIRATLIDLPSIDAVEFGQTVMVNNIKLNKGYHCSIWVNLAS